MVSETEDGGTGGCDESHIKFLYGNDGNLKQKIVDVINSKLSPCSVTDFYLFMDILHTQLLLDVGVSSCILVNLLH